MMPRKSKKKWEFGDFQTPSSLAEQAISVLGNLGITPRSIIEPTCGKGSFLIAAGRKFASAKKLIGVDVNTDYIAEVKKTVLRSGMNDIMTLIAGDFFSLNWREILRSMPEPLLIV